MDTIPKIFSSLLALFLISGCSPEEGGLELPPLAPLYDAECNRSSDVYFDMLMDTQDMPDMSTIPTDPQAAFDMALKFIRDSGRQLIQKPKLDIPFDRFTTTLQYYIYVGVNFYKNSVAKQAEIMWHEIVHVYQWERFKSEMVLLYPATHGRFSLEGPAYRMTVRMKIHFGATPEEIVAWIPLRGESFYRSYVLHSIPRKCFDQQVMTVWTADLAPTSQKLP